MNNESTNRGVRKMVRQETSKEVAEKTEKPKVDTEETERQRKFNAELISRKAPQPKAK